MLTISEVVSDDLVSLYDLIKVLIDFHELEQKDLPEIIFPHFDF